MKAKYKTGVIVQARMSSSRFPGKVLHEVNGKPLLQYLLERLKLCQTPDIITVATSLEPDDSAIADLCNRLGVACFRGPLDDVAGRFTGAAGEYGMDVFVRLSGDSPLLDPSLVDMAVKMFRSGEYDLVTNLMPATYPPGQSVEVLRTETYLRAYSLFETPRDHEHVTPYFYRHPAGFRIRNFSAAQDIRDINLCVDTPGDMDRFKAIVSRMDMPHTSYSLDDIIRIYRSLP